MIRVGINGTVVWAFELTSRLRIALAVSGNDASRVMAELAVTLRDVAELSRPFAGAVVTEHAGCFSCLRQHFFPQLEEDTTFAGPILHPCSDAGGRPSPLQGRSSGAAEEKPSNLWSRVFTLDASVLLPCRSEALEVCPAWRRALWKLVRV